MRVVLLLGLLAIPLLAPPATASHPPDLSWFCATEAVCLDWGNEGSGSWCVAARVVLVVYHTQKQCVLDPIVVPP